MNTFIIHVSERRKKLAKEIPKNYEIGLLDVCYRFKKLDKKTFFDDFIFPIEKRIRYRTKNGVREVYVKWLGYNSYGWIPLKSVTDIEK